MALPGSGSARLGTAFGPGGRLTTAQAAQYLGLTASGVRTAIQRGRLVPDGRGPRRTHWFYLATLSRFLTGATPEAGDTALPRPCVGCPFAARADEPSGRGFVHEMIARVFAPSRSAHGSEQ